MELSHYVNFYPCFTLVKVSKILTDGKIFISNVKTMKIFYLILTDMIQTVEDFLHKIYTMHFLTYDSLFNLQIRLKDFKY